MFVSLGCTVNARGDVGRHCVIEVQGKEVATKKLSQRGYSKTVELFVEDRDKTWERSFGNDESRGGRKRFDTWCKKNVVSRQINAVLWLEVTLDLMLVSVLWRTRGKSQVVGDLCQCWIFKLSSSPVSSGRQRCRCVPSDDCVCFFWCQTTDNSAFFIIDPGANLTIAIFA